MTCIVQKFGGTSVATLDRIRNVATIISNTVKSGENVVAVVSAMAGVTNKFIEYVNQLNGKEGEAEYDAVVSSGELVASGLLTLALHDIGIKARSYSGWQIPIITDEKFGYAAIKSVCPDNLQSDLKNGIIPVIAGFQGIDSAKRVTTFGRGGSDLTAVAVSAAINARICEIYSNVDGVYTVDPNIYSFARRIDKINYSEMLEMAAQGAKVLQEQSVEYAMGKNVIIRVASSFVHNVGTIISEEVQTRKFCGLSIVQELAQIKFDYDMCDDGENVVKLLEKMFLRVDVFKKRNTKMQILLDNRKKSLAIHLLKKMASIRNVKQEITRPHLSKISIVGSSFSDEIMDEIILFFKSKKIEVCNCSLTHTRINLIVYNERLTEAVTCLHKYCELGK